MFIPGPHDIILMPIIYFGEIQVGVTIFIEAKYEIEQSTINFTQNPRAISYCHCVVISVDGP